MLRYSLNADCCNVACVRFSRISATLSGSAQPSLERSKEEDDRPTSATALRWIHTKGARTHNYCQPERQICKALLSNKFVLHPSLMFSCGSRMLWSRIISAVDILIIKHCSRRCNDCDSHYSQLDHHVVGNVYQHGRLWLVSLHWPMMSCDFPSTSFLSIWGDLMIVQARCAKPTQLLMITE